MKKIFICLCLCAMALFASAQNMGLKEITIPASVKVIYPDAFGGCGNLKRVIVQSETPLVAYGSSFNISYSDTSRDYKIILKVPDSSIDVYKATAPWSTF